jgi:hypothetical protein
MRSCNFSLVFIFHWVIRKLVFATPQVRCHLTDGNLPIDASGEFLYTGLNDFGIYQSQYHMIKLLI